MPLPSTSQLLLFLITIVSLPSPSYHTQDQLALLDRTIRDSAFLTFSKHHLKTATLCNVSLPPHLTSAFADVARFRSGSLRRYGAVVKEFRISPGLVVHPHTKRLMVVRQNLGHLSTIYNAYLNSSGFQLLSPVVGLLIYDAAVLGRNSSKLKILVTKKPISVDFCGMVDLSEGQKPVCALLALDGTLTLSNRSATRCGCDVRRQGHFALVIGRESSCNKGTNDGGEDKEVGGWRVVVAGLVAAVFLAALLGLVVAAVVNVKRRRWEEAEMERRAHEEEVLQVSMVGHVRAPTASLARTAPALENDYGHRLG